MVWLAGAKIPAYSEIVLMERGISLGSLEYPLDHVSIMRGSAFPVSVAMGGFDESAALLIEQAIRFGSALRACSSCQSGSQGTKSRARLSNRPPMIWRRIFPAAWSGDSGVLAKGINGFFETKPFQIHSALGDRSGHHARDEIMSDQVLRLATMRQA